MRLLTEGKGNAKIAKSDRNSKYLSAIVHLLPHRLSGWNVCSHASVGCMSTCLNLSGLGILSSVQQARLNRTKFLFQSKDNFFDQLYKELESFTKKCKKQKRKPAIRLNGTSDLDMTRFKSTIYKDWPHIQFYDYTKDYARARFWLDGTYPSNYYLLFSRSETNEEHCWDLLSKGMNVAVVFRSKLLPKAWRGYKCINGDNSDLRFLDKSPRIVALSAKGLAKKDQTGFVV
jgi:hypothetical protein